MKKFRSSVSQLKIQPAHYVPGVCNIGPSERERRRQVGTICAVVYIVLLTVLVTVHAPNAYRLIIIVPACGALLGFLQDYLHFCTGYGLRGLYNVLKSTGHAESITSKKFRDQDRQAALLIISVALVASIALGIVSVVLP